MILLLPALAAAAFVSEPAAAATASGSDRLICRRGEETGSRTRPTRVCRTRREWQALSARRDHDNRADGDINLDSRAETPTTPSGSGMMPSDCRPGACSPQSR